MWWDGIVGVGVQKLLARYFSIQTEVAKILCMDSSGHARRSVQMEVVKVLCVGSRRHP